jgi:ribonuclease HI
LGLDGYIVRTNGVKLKKVSLITDGSCLGNPGPGGWAAILRFGQTKKELFGFEPHTTNNRMELMAPIQGLLAIKEPCEVAITTDSEYVRQGITLWVQRWKAAHWWRKNHPVRNADLWIELEELVSTHQTQWTWTKGHADHDDNNRCDWLAHNAARTQTSSWPDGRSRGTMRHELGWAYVPPRPQASLFDDVSAEAADDDDDISV